ncbi:MAG: DUF2703 domain-containing protein [Desulfobaccales bacterium]|nr:DUF2703 domain-containing protein [Desulfobaccales bacterium]
MQTLPIKWQRLVYDSQTCSRCEATGQEVQKAVTALRQSLNPLGIRVTLETEELDPATFARDPSQSNRLWVGGLPLEEWLGAQVGQSPCCGPCGDAECRTLEAQGQTYETIPAALIIKAGLRAASQLLDNPPPSGGAKPRMDRSDG